MRSQFYTVKASSRNGSKFEQRHLSYKKATGLVEDLAVWGMTNVTMDPEKQIESEQDTELRNISKMCAESHRNAVIATVVFWILICSGVAFLMIEMWK